MYNTTTKVLLGLFVGLFTFLGVNNALNQEWVLMAYNIITLLYIGLISRLMQRISDDQEEIAWLHSCMINLTRVTTEIIGTSIIALKKAKKWPGRPKGKSKKSASKPKKK